MGNVAQGIERLPFQLRQVDNVVLFDDFERGFDSTLAWNTVLSASATAAAAAGVLTLTNAGTAANDEVYLFSRQALFNPRAGKNMYMEALLQYAEANTNQANVFFGIMSGVATAALVTANGGLRTTGTAIGIYKKGGETSWRAHAQNQVGGATTLDTLSAKTAGGSAYTTLGIEIMAQLGATAEIAYRVDGTLLRDSTDPSRVIKHTIDLTSLSAAQLCVLLRAGTTASVAESVLVDYLVANIVR